MNKTYWKDEKGNRIYKGYEIFKAIANKEIKDGTQFRKLDNENIYTYRNNNFVCKYGGMNVIAILNDEFKIIEEQEEIDIQDIEEIQFPDNTNLRDTRDLIINQLVKAVKKLDKDINYIKN